MKLITYLVMILCLTSHYCIATDSTVTYLKSEAVNDDRNVYFIELLKLVFDKTQLPTNKVQLQETQDSMQQGRAIKELEAGRAIDILWSVTSIEREQQLLPIRIPLLKGLLGYRIFIIRDQEQTRFSSINTIDELQQYIAGQGHDWPDTKILKANNINVVTSPTYKGLFSMLKAKRFDYFPRGINEIWLEMDSINANGLAIDEHLLFYYPSPIYFFVNKKNKALAHRIERGLYLAMLDGSFDQLFHSIKAHQRMFELAKLKQRTMIKLTNPLLPPRTPINSAPLWLKPEQLIQE
ncbi:substrate-binding periplasmic protein [Colwelliaceae bacterium 6471]